MVPVAAFHCGRIWMGMFARHLLHHGYKHVTMNSQLILTYSQANDNLWPIVTSLICMRPLNDALHINNSF